MNPPQVRPASSCDPIRREANGLYYNAGCDSIGRLLLSTIASSSLLFLNIIRQHNMDSFDEYLLQVLKTGLEKHLIIFRYFQIRSETLLIIFGCVRNHMEGLLNSLVSFNHLYARNNSRAPEWIFMKFGTGEF